MCPSNFGFYDTIPSIIQAQTPQDALMDLIEFTIHKILHRWLINLVSSCGQPYDKQKNKIVKQMRSDSDHKWSEQGKRFLALQVKHERANKPSEWKLVLFILHKLTPRLSVNWRCKKKRPSNLDTAGWWSFADPIAVFGRAGC